MKTLFPLIISDTDLSLISQCELKWFRTRCQYLTKPAFNEDLTAGAAFAKGLETARKAFYNDKLPSNEAIDLGKTALLDSYTKALATLNMDISDILKSPARMATALQVYFNTFPLEDDEIIPVYAEDGSSATEYTFTTELSPDLKHPELNVPLIFKGKLDLLAQYLGRNYIVDEKTCKQFSAKEGELSQLSSQFLGYAYLARTKNIEITGLKLRKVAIQKTEIKCHEFEIAITPVAVDRWYNATVEKFFRLVDRYENYLKHKADATNVEFNFFTPDMKHGCTSFYKPCEFISSCNSQYTDNHLKTDFQQLVYEKESKEQISLEDYRTLLGLTD